MSLSLGVGNAIIFASFFWGYGAFGWLKVIMSKKQEAKKILSLIGMPLAQQGDICCYALLALLGLSSTRDWLAATNDWMRIHDVLEFLRKNCGVAYAENSRETFRKQAMHHFRTAAIIEDNGRATNSPNYRYRVTPEALRLFRTFGTARWKVQLDSFLSAHKKLKEVYDSKRRCNKVTVSVGAVEYALSSGVHNQLQKAVIEEFAPRFLHEFKCLYLGDTTKRDLIKDVLGLQGLGFAITLHDKMPDVVMSVPSKDWVVFVECVTSVGPISPSRLLELNQMTANVKAGKVFITAFLDKLTYKKFVEQIAWETEVWIAEDPDHMIHLNGDKFMGPHHSAV